MEVTSRRTFGSTQVREDPVVENVERLEGVSQGLKPSVVGDRCGQLAETAGLGPVTKELVKMHASDAERFGSFSVETGRQLDHYEAPPATSAAR